jgi:hypothetical protein
MCLAPKAAKRRWHSRGCGHNDAGLPAKSILNDPERKSKSQICRAAMRYLPRGGRNR